LDEAEEAAKYGTKPGEIKVEDVDKNRTIDVKDRVKFKQRPDFTIGMNNSLVIKNVDFSIFAYARVGQYINYTYNTSYKAQGLEMVRMSIIGRPKIPRMIFHVPMQV